MTVPVGRAMLASQANNAQRTTIDQFPASIGSHGLLFVFNEYKFVRSTTRPLLKLPSSGSNSVIKQSKGAVLLPIPHSLIDMNSMRVTRFDMYDQFGAENVAAAASASREAYMGGGGGLSGLSAVGSLAGNSLSDAAATAWNNITSLNNPFGGEDALFLARRMFGDNFLLGAVSQGVGATINPKASLLFQGIELKEFSFEWTMAPTEQAESTMLNNVIKRIRINSHPSYSQETVFTRAMLDYPSTVDMYLLGVDPSHFIFFKTAMIRGFNVNYTPNGLAIVRGGKPAAVHLSMQLQEMDIHTANDYLDDISGNV